MQHLDQLLSNLKYFALAAEEMGSLSKYHNIYDH